MYRCKESLSRFLKVIFPDCVLSHDNQQVAPAPIIIDRISPWSSLARVPMNGRRRLMKTCCKIAKRRQGSNRSDNLPPYWPRLRRKQATPTSKALSQGAWPCRLAITFVPGVKVRTDGALFCARTRGPGLPLRCWTGGSSKPAINKNPIATIINLARFCFMMTLRTDTTTSEFV